MSLLFLFNMFSQCPLEVFSLVRTRKRGHLNVLDQSPLCRGIITGNEVVEFGGLQKRVDGGKDTETIR